MSDFTFEKKEGLAIHGFRQTCEIVHDAELFHILSQLLGPGASMFRKTAIGQQWVLVLLEFENTEDRGQHLAVPVAVACNGLPHAQPPNPELSGDVCNAQELKHFVIGDGLVLATSFISLLACLPEK